MNIENAEQKEQQTKPKKRSYCFFGDCRTLLVCAALLLQASCSENSHTRYPVGLTEHDIRNASSMRGSARWHEVVNGWIVEEGKDQLFVGTWQIEIPRVYWVGPEMTGWEKTRLEIRPDNTFILTDPHAHMDGLRGVRKTVTGTWRVMFSTHTLTIFFTLEKTENNLPVLAVIPIQNLWTLRENDTSDQYLRLMPRPCEDPDIYGLGTPSWKKVLDE